MGRAVNVAGEKPDAFKFVCPTVSDTSRTRIGKAAAELGIDHVTIWSSVEFEENLRLRAEYLLDRFVQGTEFPDAKSEIRKFVDDFPGLTDAEALQLMSVVFDRPAFRTPFQQECSLPAFQQAIEDTIGALNTGIWRTRDGNDIRRIPSIHHLRDPRIRSVVAKVVGQVDELRRIFVARLRGGAINHCGCGQPDCPTYTFLPSAADELNDARHRILSTFLSVHAYFDVTLR
jgi:hypothetical protein